MDAAQRSTEGVPRRHWLELFKKNSVFTLVAAVLLLLSISAKLLETYFSAALIPVRYSPSVERSAERLAFPQPEAEPAGAKLESAFVDSLPVEVRHVRIVKQESSEGTPSGAGTSEQQPESARRKRSTERASAERARSDVDAAGRPLETTRRARLVKHGISTPATAGDEPAKRNERGFAAKTQQQWDAKALQQPQRPNHAPQRTAVQEKQPDVGATAPSAQLNTGASEGQKHPAYQPRKRALSSKQSAEASEDAVQSTTPAGGSRKTVMAEKGGACNILIRSNGLAFVPHENLEESFLTCEQVTQTLRVGRETSYAAYKAVNPTANICRMSTKVVEFAAVHRFALSLFTLASLLLTHLYIEGKLSSLLVMRFLPIAVCVLLNVAMYAAEFISYHRIAKGVHSHVASVLPYAVGDVVGLTQHPAAIACYSVASLLTIVFAGVGSYRSYVQYRRLDEETLAQLLS